jgi:hypothetical protein
MEVLRERGLITTIHGRGTFVSAPDASGRTMPDSSSKPDQPSRKKRPADLNRLAFSIVENASSEEPEPDPDEGKNPAAVQLGRQGGLKGGKARAEKLTPEQRSEIARKAAAARWGNTTRE